MDTAFIIGNGESRAIYPIEQLKGKGVIYGCNAIYRDHPYLCDYVVAVNTPMYDEIVANVAITNRKIERDKDKKGPLQFKLIGIDQISKWNYLLGEGDGMNDMPNGQLKGIYRVWRGYSPGKGAGVKMKTLDFAEARGSGCSAVLLAAESGIKNVVILAFDILGSRQWEYKGVRAGELSREQNNVYKNTNNYPTRMNMKAYLKYEWMFQLRQITRRHPDVNFYFINRKEYLDSNPFLAGYFDQPNIKVGIYADLQRWVEGNRDQIKWKELPNTL